MVNAQAKPNGQGAGGDRAHLRARVARIMNRYRRCD
jgi:hypothetical protein